MTPELVLAARARVGESPVWCTATQRLYWVDALAPSLNVFDPATGDNRAVPMPAPIGAVALADDGSLIVALQTGFHRLATPDAKPVAIVDPEPDRPANRLNDGRCDRQGRFWCSSMTPGNVGARRDGQLHRLQHDRAITMLTGLGTGNGLAFSPDGRVMYLSDSHPAVRTIWRFAFDRDNGVPHNRQILAVLDERSGRPDGAAIDSDGCYWCAAVDGGAVIRFTPAGSIDRRIALPVSKPSMAAFGGPDLRTLFVTSISEGVADAEPLAGGVFALDPGVSGIPEPHYAG